ncbi:spermatogenesis-associated protein 6 isoform X2 [Rhinatrema bivittatum]|uniref:spermatogenesis-associated protein 6 isoform X2 n=1 Tax=Rhinatrema bivittatum TaxID=194408 RepID=UPI00112C820A|nr:spermatogenesis-associated protein 6 isoform X2 [Rhinatrema bivittatum]
MRHACLLLLSERKYMGHPVQDRLRSFPSWQLQTKETQKAKPPQQKQESRRVVGTDWAVAAAGGAMTTAQQGAEAEERQGSRSSLGSSRESGNSTIMSAPPEGDLDVSSFAEHLISEPAGRQFRSAGLLMTRPVQKGSQTPAPSRCSLRERFQPDPNAPTNWEEIHERVRRILQTHSARQRLTFDESIPRGKDQEKQNSAAPREDSLGGTELHNRPPFHHNPSVHLDNGEYWSNRAALYKGKSHRAIFEESLEKIYRNMYKTAVSTLASRRKPQH